MWLPEVPLLQGPRQLIAPWLQSALGKEESFTVCRLSDSEPEAIAAFLGRLIERHPTHHLYLVDMLGGAHTQIQGKSRAIRLKQAPTLQPELVAERSYLESATIVGTEGGYTTEVFKASPELALALAQAVKNPFYGLSNLLLHVPSTHGEWFPLLRILQALEFCTPMHRVPLRREARVPFVQALLAVAASWGITPYLGLHDSDATHYLLSPGAFPDLGPQLLEPQGEDELLWWMTTKVAERYSGDHPFVAPAPQPA